MLALAYHVDDLVERGVLASYAEAAARLGVSQGQGLPRSCGCLTYRRGQR